MADFSTLKREDCIERPLTAGMTLTASRTVILQSVLNGIKEHGRSSMHKEVCGVLVGNLCWDKEAGAYLLIDARIEGKFADHQAGSVTFTSETWDYIHGELNEHYADRRIVGWYHTHPGFGIFLSNMDVFIHENFFGFIWQPAYVFDPQAETDGFFFWHERELEQEPVVISPDEAPVTRAVKTQTSDKILVTLSEEEDRSSRLRCIRSFGLSSILLILALLEGIMLLCVYQENLNLKQGYHDLKQRFHQIMVDYYRQHRTIEEIHRITVEEINGQNRPHTSLENTEKQRAGCQNNIGKADDSQERKETNNPEDGGSVATSEKTANASKAAKAERKAGTGKQVADVERQNDARKKNTMKPKKDQAPKAQKLNKREEHTSSSKEKAADGKQTSAETVGEGVPEQKEETPTAIRDREVPGSSEKAEEEDPWYKCIFTWCKSFLPWEWFE